MKNAQIGVYMLLLAVLVLALAAPSPAQGPDRAAGMIENDDTDGDGRISRKEWTRRPPMFDRIDTDGDGFLTKEELNAHFARLARERDKKPRDQAGPLDRKRPAESRGQGEAKSPPPGAAADGRTNQAALDRATLCGIARLRQCDIKFQIERGLLETGLKPRFPDGADCRDIDEGWAIDYSMKRDRQGFHGGIDMPAPFGTPMIAAAAGTVIAVSADEQSYRGIEIILRHGPEDTGIPLWIYTQYAHFDKMPALRVGERVRMGQALGPTGNSGLQPSMKKGTRRPAIHFAAWFSKSPNWAIVRNVVVPVDGYWMDPVALYRKTPPFDSATMRALTDDRKEVPIPVIFEDGTTSPAGTKIVWPYTCKKG